MDGDLGLRTLQPPHVPLPRLLRDKRKSVRQGPGNPTSRSHFTASSLSPQPTCTLSLGLFPLCKKEDFGPGDQSPFR